MRLEGPALRRAMERRGLSARTLAREAKVSTSTVCRAINNDGVSGRCLTVITKALDRFDVLPLVDDLLPPLERRAAAVAQQTFDF
jgi:transcriptional regulator with XRE-family HTH domain